MLNYYLKNWSKSHVEYLDQWDMLKLMTKDTRWWTAVWLQIDVRKSKAVSNCSIILLSSHSVFSYFLHTNLVFSLHSYVAVKRVTWPKSWARRLSLLSPISLCCSSFLCKISYNFSTACSHFVCNVTDDITHNNESAATYFIMS